MWRRRRRPTRASRSAISGARVARDGPARAPGAVGRRQRGSVDRSRFTTSSAPTFGRRRRVHGDLAAPRLITAFDDPATAAAWRRSRPGQCSGPGLPGRSELTAAPTTAPAPQSPSRRRLHFLMMSQPDIAASFARPSSQAQSSRGLAHWRRPRSTERGDATAASSRRTAWVLVSSRSRFRRRLTRKWSSTSAQSLPRGQARGGRASRPALRRPLVATEQRQSAGRADSEAELVDLLGALPRRPAHHRHASRGAFNDPR